MYDFTRVSIFNIAQNEFSTLIQKCVDAIHYHQTLYVAIENKIYQYNNKHIVPFYELPIAEAKIKAIHIEADRTLIGTEKHGLFVVDPKGQVAHPVKRGNVSTIFKENEQKFWIGTWEYGLYLLEKDSVTNYRHLPEQPGSISSNFVRSCCLDENGNLWIGTFNGLNMLNMKTQTFTQYTKTNDPVA